MTMEVPQYKMVLQPLAEFVAAHRKEIDERICELNKGAPLKFPISDELRKHIVINTYGTASLYAKWRETAKPERVWTH